MGDYEHPGSVAAMRDYGERMARATPEPTVSALDETEGEMFAQLERLENRVRALIVRLDHVLLPEPAEAVAEGKMIERVASEHTAHLRDARDRLSLIAWAVDRTIDRIDL